MHPVLFQIGPITIYTYGVFVASGIILGMSLALREAKKLGYDPQVILDLAFYIILAGIIGSRLLYVIQNFSSYLSNPLGVFKLWEGGLIFHGGLLLALPTGWFLVRKKNLSYLKIFDLFVPSMAIGQALGRIGCFFAGCCYGFPTNVPWAVTFTHPQSLAPQGIALHPSQLYASFACFVTFGLLIYLRKYCHVAGELACFYLVFHSAFRFTVEFFRGDTLYWILNQTITLTQAISLIFFVTAVVLYIFLRKHSLPNV